MRIRGTALVIQEEKVLLVRVLGAQKFSLPGGGTNANEPVLAAAVRELFEELGMQAHRAERLSQCDYWGSINHHQVVLIHSPDAPESNPKEIAEYQWWDGRSPLSRQSHVDAILTRWHRHRQSLK